MKDDTLNFDNTVSLGHNISTLDNPTETMMKYPPSSLIIEAYPVGSGETVKWYSGLRKLDL
jgi:hypothetical protein